MDTSFAFFRLLCYLAAGGLFALAIVPARQVSRGFFRFCAGVFAALIACGLVVRPEGLSAIAQGVRLQGAGADLALSAGAALIAAGGAVGAVQAIFVARLGTGLGRGLLKVAALLAVTGVVADGFGALGAEPSPGFPRALGPLGALSSALLLGSAIASMTLGHWYLVMPKLSPVPLMRLTWLYAISVAARAVAMILVLCALYFYGGRAFDRFMDGAGLLIWPRLLFGVFVPFMLALMALPTVKNRDTQPATGMLYVACVLVLVGEG
ncbi:MAG: hypothetical protein ACYS22_16435, partial [Planctomycetota bacterium]